jgi:hypothetical protein
MADMVLLYREYSVLDFNAMVFMTQSRIGILSGLTMGLEVLIIVHHDSVKYAQAK